MKSTWFQYCLFAVIFSCLIHLNGFTQGIKFSFNLTTSSRTSAGVFKQDGTLLRTLWSGTVYSGGLHTAVWDGKDDYKNFVANGNYIIKVLSNNVVYEWEGVVGNTSQNFSGATVHHPMQMITNMASFGTDMYFAVGYNEQGQVHSKFALGSPNIVTTTNRNKGATIRFLAADASKVFFVGQKNAEVTFASAITPNPRGIDVVSSFSSGSMLNAADASYSSYHTSDNFHYITGLAVQVNGIYLFNTIKTQNKLTIFNKTTGALVQQMTLTEPREITCDGDGNLWMISGTNTVARYPIDKNGTVGPANLTLSGLTDPLDVKVSPDGTKVAVADRGIYHQVKLFNTGTGALIATLGRAENYSNPTVYDDKFYFNNTRLFSETNYGAAHCFLAFQPDGSLWVGDYGNMRCQHFDSVGNYLDNIQFLGYSYSCQVDINDPKRVFSDFLEFEVDYSKPLAPSNGSWKFVRNWSWNMTKPTDYDQDRMRSVTTLKNGRTYALYKEDGISARELIELDYNIGVRHTGVHLKSANSELFSDGSQWEIGVNSPGKPTFWLYQPLNNFDSNNNPTWGEEILWTTSPILTATDPLTSDGYLKRNQMTSTNIMATFCSDNGKWNMGQGWHLGGIKEGKWIFKTSPSTHFDYMGEFPLDGTYDIGNNVNNAGSFMQAIERNIFWGYTGEFWKNSQTNKYNHYYDNGLFVGQFGVAGNIAKESGIEAYPGMAGNANSGTYVKIGENIYLYHCDENAHAGVHRWKISNLESIREDSISVTKEEDPQLAASECEDLMSGLPLNQSLISGTAGWTRNLGDYKNDDYDRLQIATNRTTYKTDERDVYLVYYPNSGRKTLWIKRDLGANSLLKWKISGEAAWIEDSQKGDDWIDVLDNMDRVIARINRVDNWPDGAIKANNHTIVSGNLGQTYPIFNKLQPFTISCEHNIITISYANYPPVEVPVLDSLADITKPATLRIQTYSEDRAGHQMAVARVQFCHSNYTTPSAPVVQADDANDVLSASSALGGSEILVSENGGAYVAYSGPISVGNVNRAAGYWKFKIKAATARAESAVVESPAFTKVNAVPVAPVVSLTSLIRGRFIAPANITLAADAFDADGAISMVEFYAGATKVGEVFNAPYYISWNNVGAGTYSLTAKATDNSGLTGFSREMEVVVNDVVSPTVVLTLPSSGSIFNSPDSITLAADAFDADGAISMVEFYAGATKVGEDKDYPYSISWKSVPLGKSIITARVIDNRGLIKVSQEVPIEVIQNKRLTVYPNPINNISTVEFSVPFTSSVQLQIYDIRGVLVDVPFVGVLKENTVKKIMLDNAKLSNGVYICRLNYNNGSSYTMSWLDIKIVVVR